MKLLNKMTIAEKEQFRDALQKYHDSLESAIEALAQIYLLKRTVRDRQN